MGNIISVRTRRYRQVELYIPEILIFLPGSVVYRFRSGRRCERVNVPYTRDRARRYLPLLTDTDTTMPRGELFMIIGFFYGFPRPHPDVFRSVLNSSCTKTLCTRNIAGLDGRPERERPKIRIACEGVRQRDDNVNNNNTYICIYKVSTRCIQMFL